MDKSYYRNIKVEDNMGNIYKIICMNKVMNNYQIQANTAKEALEILVNKNIYNKDNAIFSETEKFMMVEFNGYNFMTKK